MNLTVTSESAELRFKQILEDFFVSIYDEKSLFSHGIDHHRRVWLYAKELALLLSEHTPTITPEAFHNLIIACYLHDIGMSVDNGTKHGRHSREFCISFLKKNNLKEDDYIDALLAIENHDNKDYNSFAAKNDILTILSVADDLDAFGFIGIYRYSEIYLMRGIHPAKLGDKVLSNAKKRFDNFSKNFEFSDELTSKHRKRYQILVDFFNAYNKQVISHNFGTQTPSGYIGIMEIFRQSMHSEKYPSDLFRESSKNSADSTIRWYFTELEKELSFF